MPPIYPPQGVICRSPFPGNYHAVGAVYKDSGNAHREEHVGARPTDCSVAVSHMHDCDMGACDNADSIEIKAPNRSDYYPTSKENELQSGRAV